MSESADRDSGPLGVGFAAMLRGYRHAAGLTQSELAERAGLGVRTVRDLESGRAKRPQRGTVLLLADALGLAGAPRTRFEAAARVGAGLLSDTLPPPPDIVDRAPEIEELVKTVWRAEVVALLGLAGIGKTCLAVAVAHHAAGQFPGGVAGIAVSEGAGVDDLLAAAAAAFGVTEASELSERCAAAPMLLLVDGADQQADAAVAALRWLRTYAPGLRLVATSRRPIDLAGVVSWQVAPLDPAAAAELFARRLRQVRREPIGPDERVAVAELLEPMGGLPLAIELAAARARILTVPQLLARYRDRILDLGPAGAGPAAGETLRDAVSASYRLLEQSDRAALRQLATMRATWSVEIAETLLADLSGVQLEALLERLVGLGLVQARGTGEWRFRLLAVVREYATERSAESGTLTALRSRHAAVIADLATGLSRQLTGPAMLAAMSIMDTLAADIRAALRHAGTADPLTALRLAVATARWCRFRGTAAQARDLVRHLLADPRSASAQPGLRAGALHALALLAAADGDGPAELGSATEAVALYRSLGDVRGEIDARILLGQLFLVVGAVAECRTQAHLAITLARRGEWSRGIAAAGRLLASLDVVLGDLGGAQRRLATVTRLAASIGDERLVALATAQLAEVARLDGRPAEAVELSHTATAGLAEYGDPGQRVRAIATVAAALAESGRPCDADRLLPQLTCPGLYRLAAAYAARARGDLGPAAKLFTGAAEALAGRRDIREVVEALVGALGCSRDEGQRAALWLQLRAVLARGVVLLPRDQMLVAGTP